jgi:DNA polymerase elongation subunit (family B)
MRLQGIETVRRDNCLLVRNVVSTCLEKILMQKDEEGAKEYVRNIIGDLLMNRMDLSLLVVTKANPTPRYHMSNAYRTLRSNCQGCLPAISQITS